MPRSKENDEGSLPQLQGGYNLSEIERLGRERPETFESIWVELGFCFALLGSMFVAEYLISGFNILLPSLIPALNIPKQAETWPASVFSLVTGAFLLPAGRLADMYGGYIVFVSGLVWLLVWTIIAGFSQNYIMLIFCRALQGFGPAAFLPSGIMLLGSIVSTHQIYRMFPGFTSNSTVPDRERTLFSVSMAPSPLLASSRAYSLPAFPHSSPRGDGSSLSALSYSLS